MNPFLYILFWDEHKYLRRSLSTYLSSSSFLDRYKLHIWAIFFIQICTFLEFWIPLTWIFKRKWIFKFSDLYQANSFSKLPGIMRHKFRVPTTLLSEKFEISHVLPLNPLVRVYPIFWKITLVVSYDMKLYAY